MIYELTLVLPEKATPAKKKAVTETIEKMVKVFKGSVESTKDRGKMELAYPIKEELSGNFLFFELELDKESVSQLNSKLRLEEGIIRYLVVKKEQ